MPTLRATGILAVFLAVTLVGIPWQASALRFRLARRKSFPHRYHRFLCRLFGIRVTVIGRPVQDQGVLMVANHTSWLDILVFSAAARVSFVAKAEVATWPFFSTLAKLQETVFVERTRRTQTGEARDRIRTRLLEGDALVLFPEGTSSDGNRVMPFKSALMGAVEATLDSDGNGPRHVLVQPVSTAYVSVHGIPMGREYRPLFAWYGDMELVPHLWECLKAGPIDVVIEFHPTISIDNTGDRKRLAAIAEAVVREGQARALSNRPKPAKAEQQTSPELALATVKAP
ncbi:MAG: 1-acyl-sn-glycerol-3-phosphate acyltransferase [Alphaproteobacteria bacterium]|nr:1-acyl-sn-glycerol-3-phosphate acyltransferase [Alphaproteobacteria bacterium]